MSDRLFHTFLLRSSRRRIGDWGLSRQQQRTVPQLPQRLRALLPDQPFPGEAAVHYPPCGVQPPVDEGGLDFLHPDITEACLCLGQLEQGNFHTRWWGRHPLRVVQFWSATKIIPLLNVVSQANTLCPTAPLDRCQIRSPGAPRGLSLYDVAVNIVSYRQSLLPGRTSNALSAVLRRFETSEGLESWARSITSNAALEFRGNYGCTATIAFPELVDPTTGQVLLKAASETPRGPNLVAAYDLTRLISMLGWHSLLPPTAQLPGIQAQGVDLLVRALGQDCARYIDHALQVLRPLHPRANLPQPSACVVLSKDGYGPSDERHTDEVTYTAFLQFAAPLKTHGLALTLRAVRPNHGRPNSQRLILDARMATAVTEILERVAIAHLLHIS